MLFPAFELQNNLRKKVMGAAYWEKLSARRMKLERGRYLPVKQLLHGVAEGGDGSDEGEGDEDEDEGGGDGGGMKKSASERRRADDRAAQAAHDAFTGTLKDRRDKQGIKVEKKATKAPPPPKFAGSKKARIAATKKVRAPGRQEAYHALIKIYSILIFNSILRRGLYWIR